ncbi:MAG: carboxypeptidase regulatory-like domain-containing protein, partial [Chitinophagaceae bacterium]
MKKILVSILSIFSLIQLSAQDSLSVTGTIRDADKPLMAATVSLLKSADSSLVKLALTNKDGHYEFNKIPAGTYRIMATSVGYANQYSAPIELRSTTELPVLTMMPQAQSLAGVTVQAKKPMVEARLDK